MTGDTAIEVRAISFEVETGAAGLWNPEQPELSHALNAFQLALPYLEPYFIDAVKEAGPQITDPSLKADVAAFCAQEANHSRQHKRYCRHLRERYPRLEHYERAIQQSLVQSRQQDSLERRLAYTAGYEAITAQLARWFFRNVSRWPRSGGEPFAALMLWHAAEEIEHRHVAFDVLRAVNSSYALRARGLLGALRKTNADLQPVATYMLQVDGLAGRFDSRMRRLRQRTTFALELLPAALRYLSPGYHPSRDAEPPGFEEWRAHHGPASVHAEVTEGGAPSAIADA
jgi:predicted metal-dependent hydrolase